MQSTLHSRPFPCKTSRRLYLRRKWRRLMAELLAFESEVRRAAILGSFTTERVRRIEGQLDKAWHGLANARP